MNRRQTARIRRAQKSRSKIKRLGMKRLSVFRTPRHIYAQVIDDTQGRVIASASTLSSGLRADIKNGGGVTAAQQVGKLIAEVSQSAGVKQVAFDRSGYRYHGRVKALAESAREHGLEF